MSDNVRDTVILGTGCAGLTAAISAARANLKPLVLEGHEPGGQLSITTLVENFPGRPEGIQGPELIERMKLQATRFGAEIQMGHLASVDLSKRPFSLNLGKETVHTRTLIIASGASARWWAAQRTGSDWARGQLLRYLRRVLFFRQGDCGGGRRRLGDGGGAVSYPVCTKVSLIHRREQFRSSHIMLERAMAHDKIKFLTNTAVLEVMGVEQKEVTGLRFGTR